VGVDPVLQLERARALASDPGDITVDDIRLLSWAHQFVGNTYEDQSNLAGALDNYRQSLKLRQELVKSDPDSLLATGAAPEVERDKLSTDEMFKKPVQTWTEEDWRQWNKETERHSKLIFVPRLRFFITTIELESGCAGVLMAGVIATLKPSTIISTEIPVRYPDFTI
jgi:hypothetical protein